MAVAQQERKAKLETGRVDMMFKVAQPEFSGCPAGPGASRTVYASARVLVVYGSSFQRAADVPVLTKLSCGTRAPSQGGGPLCCVLTRAKELLDAADIGKLRWAGPFPVTACPSPNAYTLAAALSRKMRCSPPVNVDRTRLNLSPSTLGPTTLRLRARCPSPTRRARGGAAAARPKGLGG